MRGMGKWLVDMLDRIFVLLAALLFSQMPLYMQEYEQRLAGHVEELRHQIDALQKLALKSGKTFEEYIGKFAANSDPDIAKHGSFIEAMQHRYASLSEGLHQLIGASLVSKPFLFIKHLDFEIGRGALYHFKPGFLFTLEGLTYALVGMGVGYLLFSLLRSLFRFFTGKPAFQ